MATVRTRQVPPLLHQRWVAVELLRGGDDKDVVGKLLGLGLPTTLQHVMATRAKLGLPARAPRGRAARSLTDSIALAGVEGVFAGTQDAKAAEAILKRGGRAREFLESGLLVGVPPRVLEQELTAKLVPDLPPGTAATYQALFLDVERVTRAQLRLEVAARVTASLPRDLAPDVLRRAVASDPRTHAARLPATPAAWLAIMHRLGITPTLDPKQLADLIGQLENLAAAGAAEVLLRGGRGSGREALDYVKTLTAVREVRETLRRPEETMQRTLSALRLRTRPHGIKTIAQLRAAGDEVGTLDPPVHGRHAVE